jgi:hypothetical protein
MSAKPNEVISAVLSSSEMQKAIENLPQALNSIMGNSLLQAMYGHGCNLHAELCYIPVKVGTSWLERFIHNSLQQRIVVPCESDFIFIIQEGKLEVEFCHEGHIHISGTNPELIGKLLENPVFAFISTVGIS